MNLENLSKAINEAGLTRAIITLDTNGADAVVIVNIPTANADSIPDLKDEKQMALRKALSIPMRIMGKTTEVDGEIDLHIEKYAEGFVPAAQALPVVTKSNSTPAASKQTEAATTATKGATAQAKKQAKKQVEAQKPSPVEKAQPDAPITDNYDFFADSGAL
ncbi:hypothetical protein [Vibrio parahaemolyticus]|uniref:hypothetical protein n=1 Tax=Vibrio parahaemolyticus TaxID=670 RepID=UPI0023EC5BE8|nr:hypothetical protein [Vibrio parahaemolyticus]